MDSFNIVYFLDWKYEQGIPLYGRYLINRRGNNIAIRENQGFCNIYGLSNDVTSNIASCHTIVGNNGVGKTCLLYHLINLIDNPCVIDNFNLKANSELHKYQKFLFIYEYDDKLYAYQPDTCPIAYTITYNNRNIELVDEVAIREHLKVVQSVYLQNNLSFHDYVQDKPDCMDFSVGHLIHKYTSDITSQHYSAIEYSSVMSNYYFCENLKIVNLLYGIQSEGIGLLADIRDNLPKKIEIKFRERSDFEQYIIKNLRKHKDDAMFSLLADLLTNLRRAKRCGWKNEMSYCLLWNYISSWLVPNTTPWNKPNYFEESIHRLENIFGQAEKKGTNGEGFTSKVADYFEQERSNHDKCTKFLTFLQCYTDKDVTDYESSYFGNSYLKIPVNSHTDAFVKDIFSKYQDVMFEFPFLDFSFGCSSGEYYILSLFANLYSLKKNDTVVFSYQLKPEDTSNLYLLFDEAETSMHPDWQRKFISWIIDFCKVILYEFCVHIIVATHSPILLSDFPSFSVTYLSRDNDTVLGKVDLYKKTLAREVHMLYLDSFELENKGIIGYFAEQVITKLCSEESYEKISESTRKEHGLIINQIGDELIRRELMVKYEQSDFLEKQEKKVSREEYVNDVIKQLKDQRDALDIMIKNLEGKGNDKN